MEKDDEIIGSGNMYTTEFRENDTRLGRWWSVDPLASDYPAPLDLQSCGIKNKTPVVADL